MSGIGCMLAVMAGICMLIGLIPFLGWINWITTLPFSLLAALFCYQGMRQEPSNGIARLGLVASVLVFAIGAFRLSLGAGII